MNIDIETAQKVLKDMGINTEGLSRKRQMEIFSGLSEKKFVNYKHTQKGDDNYVVGESGVEVLLDIKGACDYNSLLNSMLQNRKINFVCVEPDFYISFTLLSWEDNLEPGFIVLKGGEEHRFFGEDVKVVFDESK